MGQPRTTLDDELCPRSSVRSRIVLWLYGVLLPLVCFTVSATIGEIGAERPWQSGKISDYAAMLLRPRAWLAFSPWLLLSMCSLSWWTYQPSAAKKPWVRLGLYCGVILAVQYLCVIILFTNIACIVAAFFVLPSVFAISIIASSIASHYKRFQIWHLLCLTTLVAVCVAVIQLLPSHVINFPFIALIFVLAATPVLTLLAYVRAAVLICWIDKSGLEQSHRVFAMFASWILGWLISWRFAVLAMFDEYNRLPISNPNCYFANAAANAHSCLGGRRPPAAEYATRGKIGDAGGTAATLSMKRLKFLELVLLATAPCTHRFIRCYYDRWGQPAARYCSQHYWFANLTCLALKPVEALAEIVRLISGISRARVAAIYESELSFSARSASSAVKSFSIPEDAEGAESVRFK